MINFILILNRSGVTRLSRYYISDLTDKQKKEMEREIVRMLLRRSGDDFSCFRQNGMKFVYLRKHALYFVASIDEDENQMSIRSFFENFVNILDRTIDRFSELSMIRFINFIYAILDDMVVSGKILCVDEVSARNMIVSTGPSSTG